MQSFSRLILLVAASVSVLILAVSYLFFTGFGDYMLRSAAVKQADTVAQFTFSTMYQLMSKGWNRDQVVRFADNAAASVANTPTRITFFRGEPVSRQFGEVSGQHQDDDIAIVLKSGRSRQVDYGGGVTYHMPLVAQADCLRCHTEVKTGEVLGVITVKTQFGPLMQETSLHMLLVLLLFAPTPFIAALMVALHLDSRFETFAGDIEAVAERVKAGQPPDFSRIKPRYAEFEEVLARIRNLAAALRP